MIWYPRASTLWLLHYFIEDILDNEALNHKEEHLKTDEGKNDDVTRVRFTMESILNLELSKDWMKHAAPRD